jgi:hypothetical protein
VQYVNLEDQERIRCNVYGKDDEIKGKILIKASRALEHIGISVKFIGRTEVCVKAKDSAHTP